MNIDLWTLGILVGAGFTCGLCLGVALTYFNYMKGLHATIDNAIKAQNEAVSNADSKHNIIHLKRK